MIESILGYLFITIVLYAGAIVLLYLFAWSILILCKLLKDGD
jgi:hypothetical protein